MQTMTRTEVSSERIEAMLQNLETEREATAQELDKIDSKIEVLKEVLSCSTQQAARLPEPLSNGTKGNKAAKVQRLIDELIEEDGEVSASSLFARSRQACPELSKADIYVALQWALRRGAIRVGSVRPAGGSTRPVNHYVPA